MKVTAIETHICHCYRTNWVFVEVTTDAGITGWGEATLEHREATTAEAVQELGRYLVGRDPRRIEAFRHDCYRDAYWRGGPVLQSAIAGVEMALWDIKGKALDTPVYELLGGKLRDTIPCYANGWFAPARSPDEFAEKAKLAVADGFRGLKWDPFGKAWMELTKAELRQAMTCVQAVVDAVGDEVQILIEGHGRFNVPTAIRIGQALEDFDILWFEEPIPPDNLEALAEVKRRVRVPIATGERLYSRQDFRQLFDLQCADFVQPDCGHAGGIFEMRLIASMAETAYIPFCPHNPSGPVATAANLQLAACVPNFYTLETMNTDVPWRQQVCDERIELVDGQMRIPTRPGLGVNVFPDKVAEHPYEPQDLRHYRGDLTDIRPPDAVSIVAEA